MTQNGEEYLAVLKASYDYEPQSEDEIAIKENQIVFLLERTDDDWWRVKIKGDSQEEDSPSGLVPAAYVEQAAHTSIAKALYEYSAAAPGELSIKEDEILLVFDREDEWVLVQNQKEGGKAGFVPGNYIEESGGEESIPEPEPEAEAEVEPEPEPEPEPESESELPPPPPRAVPPSPKPPARPVSVYVDPADRVAQHPVRAQPDHIKTWSVSEVDKKNKKKKGTLGIGNGTLFFARESDKGPVQKWDTADVEDFTIEKQKHIIIDMGGATPAKLHFHVGKEEIAEAILTKLDDSRHLARATNGDSNIHRSALTPPPRPVDVGSPSKKNGVSVRFTEESPEIIPPREPSEDGEADGEGAEQEGELATALYDFEGTGLDELSVQEGERLHIIEKEGEEWWKCRNVHGAEGVVPASYLESLGPSASARSEADEAQARADQNREEAEKKEREGRERAEKERKKAEEERAKVAAVAQKKLQEQERDAAVKKLQQEKRARQKAEDEQSGSSRSQSTTKSSRTSSENKNGPPPESTRTWHDRSGQFRVEAALLGYSNGKLRLHKVNGVVIEVPSEKMSVEDMRYVERLMKKKPSTSSSAPPRSPNDDDDKPLGLKLPSENVKREPVAQQKKKGPQIDWFDFFLEAGCDLDDCTRYANSFERDKIDESLLPDITESTMRSLGLREGDIIRVNKAIQQKYPKAKAQDPQVTDGELAARLQEEENMKKPISPAPNLFSGPGGVLKNNTVRRGRPQPSNRTLPSTVDLDGIGTASEQIKRTGSPLVRTDSPSGGSPVQPPQRTSSAMATVSGFDDDAWTNRPGSKPPAVPTPPASAPPRVPSAPPAPQPAVTPTPPAAPPTPQESTTTAPNSLAKTTEADVFEQLARLSHLKTNRAVPSPPAVAPVAPVSSPPVVVSPPPGYNTGLGMGSSPVPMGQHLHNQQSGSLPPHQQNGPRGPYAPVPANQGLLQPLIPTQTGFNSFVPTRPSNISPPFQPPPQIVQPSFLQSQPTGFPSNPQPLISQPTGFPTAGPLLTQPTGMASGMFGGFAPTSSFPNTPVAPMQTNPTGFSPFGQSPFNDVVTAPSPAPPLPMAPSSNSGTGTNTSPANIFAQMKSGTFASGNEHSVPQQSERYDALRVNPQPTGWAPQAAGWGIQPNTGFQNGYTGF